MSDNDQIMGLTYAVFISSLLLSLLLWTFMIIWTIMVLKRCQNRTQWFKPTVITLLVLWILLGSWIPGLSIILFLCLLVLLLQQQQYCN